MCSFDRNHILVEDLEHFLPRHKAVKAFEMLDVDCDGQVSLHDIRDAVLQIYRVCPPSQTTAGLGSGCCMVPPSGSGSSHQQAETLGTPVAGALQTGPAAAATEAQTCGRSLAPTARSRPGSS